MEKEQTFYQELKAKDTPVGNSLNSAVSWELCWAFTKPV